MSRRSVIALRTRAGFGAALGLVVGLALMALADPSLAQSTAASDDRSRASFRVERTREVENDRVRVVLSATAEDADAAKVADQVNRAMAWALEKAKGAAGVSVRSGGYRTFPITDKARLKRWRASQELILEASSVDQVSGLIGTLQEQLQVQALTFSVSDARRRETETELIGQVLAAFRERAERIQHGLGAKGYDIESVSIETHGRVPGPMPVMRGMMAAAEAAPPALEAGTSTVTVGATGTVRLR